MTDQEAKETTDMLLHGAHFLVDIECQSPATTRYECCSLWVASPRGARHIAIMLAAVVTHDMRGFMTDVREQGGRASAEFQLVGPDDRVISPDDAHPVGVVVARMLQLTAESDLDGAYAVLDEFMADRAPLMPDVLTALTRAAHAETHK